MIEDFVKLDRDNEKPMYLQIATQIGELIRSGILDNGLKIPSTRQLSKSWKIHRKTVIAAMDKLEHEGWIIRKKGSGTFISANLKSEKVITIADHSKEFKSPWTPPSEIAARPLHLVNQSNRLDDGLPDPRLAPISELLRAYKSSLGRGEKVNRFGYVEMKGNIMLRKELVKYLARSRGMKISEDQILVTRGVTQALYLFIHGCLTKGEHIAVPEVTWQSANENFKHYGLILHKIRVDHEGLNTQHLEEVCNKFMIKGLYITPHHQYPTTVILPAHRRMHLLRLIHMHGFQVFEDDYDFDFHYETAPIMPIYSASKSDQVLYAGSFTKAIAPAFRIGYLVGSESKIEHLARLRRFIDRQGDNLMEHAFAELLHLDIIPRTIRRNRKIYQQRRNHFCQLLEKELGDFCLFSKPSGGMAVWTHFEKGIDLKKLSQTLLKDDLYIQNGLSTDVSELELNAIRMGFASSNTSELDKSVNLLSRRLKKL